MLTIRKTDIIGRIFFIIKFSFRVNQNISVAVFHQKLTTQPPKFYCKEPPNII